MLDVKLTKVMQRDLKRVKKRNKNTDKLYKIVSLLADRKPLEEKYRDHTLTGDWNRCHECHIEPDWLLIYRVEKTYIILERTGSHSDLFK